MSVAKYIGSDLTEQQLEFAMLKYTGKKIRPLNYAQVVKLLTGKDVDATIDPYDGKLKKTGYCLLL
jgi:TRAP-type C4-dicarboxylate transport system substrate-binding protein